MKKYLSLKSHFNKDFNKVLDYIVSIILSSQIFKVLVWNSIIYDYRVYVNQMKPTAGCDPIRHKLHHHQHATYVINVSSTA